MNARAIAESRVGFVHFHEIATRWMDNDSYGHVNNVVYYSYFDTAVNYYLIKQGLLDFRQSDVIGLVVETKCCYFRAVAFPDTIYVGVRVANISTSSVRYELGIFSNDDEIAAAQGHFVHVYVNRETNRPVPLPVSYREALMLLSRDT